MTRGRRSDQSGRGRGGGRTIAAGYLRRSTDRQEQSLADQQAAIERWAADHEVVVDRWHVDDAISGTTSARRPGFQKLIAEARESPPPFTMVLVYDVKRFGRVDNDEAGYYRHLLKQNGIEVVYVAEGFSSAPGGSDTDDLLRPVKQWQARQESKDLSKVTIRGLLSKSETGAWMGGVAPHGYDLRYETDRGEFLFVLRHNPDGTKHLLDERGRVTRTLPRGESIQVSKRDRARLVPGEPSRVETVRTIFRLYADERLGLKVIAEHLNTHGHPTPRGPMWSERYDGKWRVSTVRSLLVNPIYRGDMVWNRRTDARFHMIQKTEHGARAVERRQAHGARLVPNDEADWIVVPGTHEALVPRKQWERAQQTREAKPVSECQRDKPRVVGGWTGARSRFALSGLVRCALCKGRYQGITRRKGQPKADGAFIKTYSYACGGYIAKGTSACAHNPVGQELLEGLVVRTVLGFYQERFGGRHGHDRLAGAVREALGFESVDLAQAKKRLKAERSRIETSIANLLDTLTPSTRDLIEPRLDELRRERQALETREGELDRLATEETKLEDVTQELGRFLAGLEFTLERGLPVERMCALRRCVTTVVVDKPKGAASVGLRPLPTAAFAQAAEHRMTVALGATPTRAQ